MTPRFFGNRRKLPDAGRAVTRPLDSPKAPVKARDSKGSTQTGAPVVPAQAAIKERDDYADRADVRLKVQLPQREAASVPRVQSAPLRSDTLAVVAQLKARWPEELFDESSLAVALNGVVLSGQTLAEYVDSLEALGKEVGAPGEPPSFIELAATRLDSTEKLALLRDAAREAEARFPVPPAVVASAPTNDPGGLSGFLLAEYILRPGTAPPEQMQGQLEALSTACHRSQRMEVGGWDALMTVMSRTDPVQGSTDLARVLRFLEETRALSPPLETVVWKTVAHLGNRGRLDASTFDDLSHHFLPALQRPDSGVARLIDRSELWGDHERSGLGDVILKCALTSASPPTMHLLLRMLATVPESAARWQNVQDGNALGERLTLVFQNFIHSRRPEVHSVAEAMLRYHRAPYGEKTEARADLDEALEQVARSSKKQFFAHAKDRKCMLDLNRYRTPVRVEVDGTWRIQTVDEVLKRVAENNRPREVPPPTTGFPAPDAALSRVADGASILSSDRNGPLLGALNDVLEARCADPRGRFAPSLVAAVAWAEEQLFDAFSALPYEQQRGMHRQPEIVELVRFQELTCSAERYDASGFKRFRRSLSRMDPDGGLVALFRRTISRIDRLAAAARAAGRSTGQEWSGNLDSLLIAVLEPRPAQTPLGEKNRAERLPPPYARVWGD